MPHYAAFDYYPPVAGLKGLISSQTSHLLPRANPTYREKRLRIRGEINYSG